MYCIVLYNKYRFDFVWRKRRHSEWPPWHSLSSVNSSPVTNFVRSWSYYKISNVIQPKYFLSDENIQEAIAIFLCCIYSWFLIAGQCTRKGYLVQRNFCHTRKGSRACIMNVIKVVLGSFEQLLPDFFHSTLPTESTTVCLPVRHHFEISNIGPLNHPRVPKMAFLTPPKVPFELERSEKKVKKTDYPKSGHSEAIYIHGEIFQDFSRKKLPSRGLGYYGMILLIFWVRFSHHR